MTDRLRKRVAEAKSLVQALHMLEGEPEVSGTLKIKAGDREATLAVDNGRITGAALTPGREHGQEVLAMLADMQDGTIRYSKFKGVSSFGPPLDITLDSMIKQLSVQHGADQPVTRRDPASEQAEFEAATAGLGNGAGALSAHQLSMLAAAREGAENDASFHQSDPELAVHDEQLKLSERHAAMLADAKLDHKPFTHVDKPISWDAPSLSDTQRDRLKTCAEEGRDLKTFAQVTDFFKKEGMFLTEQQESELRKVASQRSRDECLEEFHQDAGWEHSEPIEIKGLVEHIAERTAPGETGGPIPKGEITDHDRSPLRLFPETPQPAMRQVNNGIIGRQGKFALARLYVLNYTRRARKEMPAGAIFGIACLSLLAMCLIVVPNQIKNSAGGGLTAEQRARERLKQSIHEDLAKDTPQESAELTPNKTASASAPNTTAPENGFSSSETPETEDLRFGRSLIAKGQLEPAVPYYESYVRNNPDSLPARIELINVYIATKSHYSARLLCIRTMKRQLNAKDLTTLWQLLSQCQTD